MRIDPNPYRKSLSSSPPLRKAGGKKAPLSKKAEWSVLCYFAANDHLDQLLVKNLDDLEKTKLPAGVNLAAQIANRPEFCFSELGKAGFARYEIKNRRARLIKDQDRVKITDPKLLKDFLAWGMKKYPAEKYLVLFNLHGSGWPGFATPQGSMKTQELSKALADAEKEAGVNPDDVLLNLESCMMMQTEAMYDFKDSAHLAVGSQFVSGFIVFVS